MKRAGRPETESPTPRRGDSRSLPVVCECDSNHSPAGLEPTGAAIADHPLASSGSLDQPPEATNIVLYLEEDVAHFFEAVFPGEIEAQRPQASPQTSVWGCGRVEVDG